MNLRLFDLALLCYLLSLLLWILSARISPLAKGAKGLMAFGAIVHMAGMGVRWWESYLLGFSYPPFSNMYESLVLFSLAIVVFYLGFSRRFPWGVFGLLASLASALLLWLPMAIGMDRGLRPLVPALQSPWLIAHVITCFLGYGSFALGFLLSLLYLLGIRPSPFVPPREALEEGTYRAILTGFLFFTVGIVTGSIWAHYAWGRYWSWDPKETWSLITWLIYAGWLHAHLVKGWRGKRTAVLSVVGFASVIFTYFGVNYLLQGLHSYA